MTVLWIRNPAVLPTIIDTEELSGGQFFPVSELLNPENQLSFRRFPNTGEMIKILWQNGYFDPKITRSVKISLNKANSKGARWTRQERYQPMKKITLLKLGGSLITDKTKPFTARLDIIRNLAGQIKEALTEEPDLQLILGNGSGSFAHVPATEYRMSGKIQNKKQKMGFCLVQNAAARLNQMVVSALLAAGVRAVSLQPSAMIDSQAGAIARFNLDPLLSAMKMNLVPVFYGDIVFDSELGFKIYSTEQLLSAVVLAFKKKRLPVERIIHNGITKGVLDQDGGLISHITRSTYGKIKPLLNGVTGYDITGGMSHKIEESMKLAEKNISTLIINGTSSPDLLKNALLGKPVEGTVISY
ncbi:isopentenyl phosphate kinase family protein [Candidatus Roizmanbacteria bacterium]|nr:isopentenyl phosphate kinase family protein [Candidatus Roizmanbacteria bacterium]